MPQTGLSQYTVSSWAVLHVSGAGQGSEGGAQSHIAHSIQVQPPPFLALPSPHCPLVVLTYQAHPELRLLGFHCLSPSPTLHLYLLCLLVLDPQQSFAPLLLRHEAPVQHAASS